MAERNRALDILRGVAVLAVVFHHLIGVHVYPEGWWLEYGYAYFLGTWLTHGWLGVSLFFVLSGFVLFLPYAQGRRQFLVMGDTLKFYRHRARRLLPLYYISTFVALFILGNFWPHYNLERAFAMATLTFNFFPKYFAPPGNTPLWSLGIEVWYCILFPALALLFLKPKPKVVFFWVSVIAYLTRVAGDSLDSRMITNSILGHLGAFSLGMWIALSWAKTSTWTNWSASFAFGSAVAGFFIMTSAALLFDIDIFPSSPWIYAAYPLIFQLGTALLLMGLLAWGNRANSFVWRSAWVLELIGMMCYSIYLWHVPLLAGLRPTVTRPLEVLVYLGVLLVFSWLSYRHIEFGHVRDWRALLPSDPLRAVQKTSPEIKAAGGPADG